jgi:cell division protein ZapA
MKQVEVIIMSQSYVLQCPEDGETLLRQAVARVDAAMCRIRDAGKIKARERIAVLAALNLAFELPNASASLGVAATVNDGALAAPAITPPPLRNTDVSAASAEAVASSRSTSSVQALIEKIDHSLAQDSQLI